MEKPQPGLSLNMTKEDFNNLKIGDRCYLKRWDGQYDSTEVLQIDRIFGKLTVLLRSKPVHYSKIPLKLNEHQKQSGFVFGTFRL